METIKENWFGDLNENQIRFVKSLPYYKEKYTHCFGGEKPMHRSQHLPIMKNTVNVLNKKYFDPKPQFSDEMLDPDNDAFLIRFFRSKGKAIESFDIGDIASIHPRVLRDLNGITSTSHALRKNPYDKEAFIRGIYHLLEFIRCMERSFPSMPRVDLGEWYPKDFDSELLAMEVLYS